MKREARNPCSHGVKRENPEGVTDHRQVYNPCVTDPRQGMKREARNPCSHGVKSENPEGVTDHRQVYNPCVIDSGICRTFGTTVFCGTL